MNILDIFKKPVTSPLPKFLPIYAEKLPAASALLFYGGVRLTELVGNRLYKHPYSPPAFHAAFYIDNGLFLNVGAFRTVQELEKEFRSTRRIDAIICKALTPENRAFLCRHAILNTSKPKIGLEFPDYSWSDYLRFGLRFLHPSKKDFCSENVVELFNDGNITISDNRAVDTAPWDIFEYVLKHPEAFEIRTVWVGPEFKG